MSWVQVWRIWWAGPGYFVLVNYFCCYYYDLKLFSIGRSTTEFLRKFPWSLPCCPPSLVAADTMSSLSLSHLILPVYCRTASNLGWARGPNKQAVYKVRVNKWWRKVKGFSWNLWHFSWFSTRQPRRAEDAS